MPFNDSCYNCGRKLILNSATIHIPWHDKYCSYFCSKTNYRNREKTQKFIEKNTINYEKKEKKDLENNASNFELLDVETMKFTIDNIKDNDKDKDKDDDNENYNYKKKANIKKFIKKRPPPIKIPYNRNSIVSKWVSPNFYY